MGNIHINREGGREGVREERGKEERRGGGRERLMERGRKWAYGSKGGREGDYIKRKHPIIFIFFVHFNINEQT